MRIRTQLGITAALILGTLGLMTLAGIQQQRGRAELAQAQADLALLVAGAHELSVLSSELLLYPSERVRSQWRMRQASLAASLDSKGCCRNSMGPSFVEDVEERQRKLGELFDRVVALGPAEQDDADTALLRARLATQVLTRSRDLTSWLEERRAAKRESAFADLRRTGFIVVTVNVSAFLVTALLLWLLWRNLSRPLAELRQGFDRVAAGDLDYRVDRGRRDELGDLARGFDHMTEQVALKARRLSASEAALATANEILEQRVDERTAELNQAKARLEQAVQQLYDAGDEMAHTERLATLGKLVASVSHELNNPLMGALNYVQHVRVKLTGEPLGDALVGWLDKAERDILRASRVTGNLLSFGRKRTERRAAIKPTELVSSTLELALPALKRAGVDAENRVPENLREVFGEHELLRQVLLNLILNAVDALKDAPVKRILITGRAAKHRIELAVEDTGPGVPEPFRGRIFEPFFTTKADGEGTGLGLAIARRLIEGGGGTLNYVQGDRGASFVLSLPPLEEDIARDAVPLSPDLKQPELSARPNQAERG
ncbi:sensor histidine kinase [Thiocapsa bogorovii]|uniref:sensor histidine kinase n=1 Tax=Thiocapsa bogorovii TaxID=521689 RepID=UPI001E5B8D8E|nr:ATP-binding protein [Thiocapsa bogorovii]UHD15153.1 ATP-binding protein [Thiocapsa bogorovii]